MKPSGTSAPARRSTAYTRDEELVLGAQAQPERLLQLAEATGNRAARAVALDLIRAEKRRRQRHAVHVRVTHDTGDTSR